MFLKLIQASLVHGVNTYVDVRVVYFGDQHMLKMDHLCLGLNVCIFLSPLQTLELWRNKYDKLYTVYHIFSPQHGWWPRESLKLLAQALALWPRSCGASFGLFVLCWCSSQLGALETLIRWPHESWDHVSVSVWFSAFGGSYTQANAHHNGTATGGCLCCSSLPSLTSWMKLNTYSYQDIWSC